MNRDVKLSTFGTELMLLYGRANLSQGEFATLIGISPSALRRWESDTSCPKAESLKRVVETLLSQRAFSQGEEQVEAIHLWELANKRGLKVPFDEAWFRGLMQDPASVGEDENLILSPSSDGGDAHLTTLDTNLRTKMESVRTDRFALFTNYMRNRRKILLLIALVILTIIGSVGSLLFYARYHATAQANKGFMNQTSKIVTDQSYPGYLSGHGTLAFFDPLSQASGSQWASFDTNSTGGTCHFTKGAYHVSKPVTPNMTWCPSFGSFSNFAFEVLLTIAGGDCGGIFIRDNYYFHLCENGYYRMCKYLNNYSSDSITLSSRTISAFHTGLGHENKIAVVASGNIMTFYINEQQIDQVQDSSFTAGHVSLSVTALSSATDVAYRNARLWTL